MLQMYAFFIEESLVFNFKMQWNSNIENILLKTNFLRKVLPDILTILSKERFFYLNDDDEQKKRQVYVC